MHSIRCRWEDFRPCRRHYARRMLVGMEVRNLGTGSVLRASSPPSVSLRFRSSKGEIHMHKPTARTRRLATLIIGPTAILVAGLLVWQGSNAAFTATTRNAGNNWATGSVVLSDDSLGAAAFRVTGVTPGQTGSKCLVVTSQSTVPGEVRFYLGTLGAQDSSPPLPCRRNQSSRPPRV
jgi:hypothetical protein